MIWMWLKCFLFSPKSIFKVKTLLSLVGLILGVACLVVTMTVMNSYKTTLRKTIVDRTGHIIIAKREGGENEEALYKKIAPLVPSLQSYTPFISVEALALADGSLSGILLEGLDEKSLDKVIHVKNLLIQGRFFNKSNEAVIGSKLADHLNLQVGSSFSVAVSQKENSPQGQWFPSLENFSVAGIVDLGRHDFNSRYAAVPLSAVQKLLGQINTVGGLKLRLTEEEFSRELIDNLKQKLGIQFWVQDWKSINENLFAAIEMEKIIIFFVLLVLVIAAGFNISTQLMVDVLRRFRDIGILKTIGAKPSLIAQLFFIQCFIISVVGTILGFFVGILMSYGLFVFYDIWGAVVPSDIYKLNKIVLDFRWQDFFSIFVFSVFICMLGAWVPTRKALRLSPREGLNYE